MNWKTKVNEQQLQVGVIGLGYVGLPLAVAFAREGFQVLGFDVDSERVEQINSGQSPVSDVDSEELQRFNGSGRLEATTDMTRMEAVDTLHICVPTPLRKSRDPDISYILASVETITENFTPPGLVILESTTYPGTTEEVVAEAFEKQGWNLEDEALLAFSPERIDPGNEQFGIRNTPKVIGGYSKEASRVAELIYGQVADQVVSVSSPREAEMVKLLENTFRSINIGLANEMALICDRLGINVWEVIEAAATKPFGFMPFYPGPGLGGHCIPVDPLFLSWRANLEEATTRFIELADEINRGMPEHVFKKITEGLNKFKKSVNGSRICIFGVAYKPGVSDTRESPAFNIVEQLLDAGAQVEYCDPYVDEFEVAGQDIFPKKQTEITNDDYDAGVIITDHDDFDWHNLLHKFNLLIDTRNGLSGFDIPAELELIHL